MEHPHHDDSLTGLAHRVLRPDDPIDDRIHALETRIADRATHQVETRLLTGTGS
ncbi:hypothetical protein AB0L13_07845 [Saccharopolyspora shandongensis]|uniref:hypothetical protein n=1 Tax=Saccharopolyspora shandongensis TaxID=418495 RepID=UPI003422E364